MKYVSSLYHPVTYDDMHSIYEEVCKLHSCENFSAMDELYQHVYNMMYQTSISEDDIKKFDELRSDVMAQFEAEERGYNLQYIRNLIGHADGSYKDNEESDRFWLSADGCYSSMSILKSLGTSVKELRSAMNELGVDKDDYNITYDDETCHLTLPESLLEEVYKLDEL